MQKVYAATRYFIIGYSILVAMMTLLYYLPSSLKSSIGFVVAAIVFVDLSYRFFKKSNLNVQPISWQTVIGWMTYWAILSIALDVLLLVILMPLLSTGSISWAFFKQQPDIYWFQFPMFYVFGFVGQAIYNRVISISEANVN